MADSSSPVLFLAVDHTPHSYPVKIGYDRTWDVVRVCLLSSLPPFSLLKLGVKIKLNLPAFIVAAAIKPLVGNVKE